VLGRVEGIFGYETVDGMYVVVEGRA